LNANLLELSQLTLLEAYGFQYARGRNTNLLSREDGGLYVTVFYAPWIDDCNRVVPLQGHFVYKNYTPGGTKSLNMLGIFRRKHCAHFEVFCTRC
jgi:hypothetical protein